MEAPENIFNKAEELTNKNYKENMHHTGYQIVTQF